MSWKPPQSLWEWHAPHDPEGGTYSGNIYLDRWIRMLVRASPSAFGDVERQLSSTAQLAAVTAQGLRGADAAQWEGDAGDAYRKALGKLPTVLDQVHDSYMSALGAFAAFSETTFELQGKYRTFQSDLAAKRSSWESALTSTYSDAHTGWAHIHRLQDDLRTICARGWSILGASNDALSDLQGRLQPLIDSAPAIHESDWQKVLHPFKEFLGEITGTWHAFSEFTHHRTWKNFADLTEDLAVDAGVVLVAASAPEGLAGIGLIDAGADSSLLTVSEAGASTARGVGLAATGLNVTSDEFDHDYGTGALEALLVLAPGAKEAFGPNELQSTVGEAKIVAYYKEGLDAGDTPARAMAGLNDDEAAALKKIIPHYRDPAAVDAATKRIAGELRAVRGEVAREAPKGFIWENGVLIPVSKAGGKDIDRAVGAGDGHH